MTENEERRDNELVKLCTVENAVEAQVLEGLLRDRGIACELFTWHSIAYDGIFEQQKGHADMKVRAEDLERAREVHADFLAQYRSDATDGDAAPDGR